MSAKKRTSFPLYMSGVVGLAMLSFGCGGPSMLRDDPPEFRHAVYAPTGAHASNQQTRSFKDMVREPRILFKASAYPLEERFFTDEQDYNCLKLLEFMSLCGK
jgi:hypothetical protein